jgi:ferredoxin-NADP reductase
MYPPWPSGAAGIFAQGGSVGQEEDVNHRTRTVVAEHEADLVVAAKEAVAEDVVAVELTDPDGATLPAWTPGAHVDLVLSDSLTRQYSLCGSAADRRKWRIGVLKDPGSRGGSAFVHEQLQVGSTVRVRGPRNHFPLITAPRYRFIAGGIGITPLIPMISEAHAAGADWQLLYGGRRRDSMAFVAELAAHGDRVRLHPQDELGMLDLPSVLERPQPGTLVYCCGPEGLLTAVESHCREWPAGSLHVERFSAKPQEPAPEGDTAFELVLQRSGITLEVPADVSVLEVCEDAGVSVLGSCYEGICGTCETAVIDGVPDHRDSVLTEDEQAVGDVMMICVSRCKGPRLTLDL